ncbi:hypothetical protein [Yersinia aleksiciae]|uniref:hypothetical protein n=1 Tax=Yersinia aleksiciae TaxID=263819 RepID=UPI0021BCFD3C|nr:hypothetical protein [Yersinia aleksiciae]
MQKIGDIPNTRADINGEFTDGNVAGGVPPTILPAEWFNTLQRELMSVLSAADIDADSAKFNQVAAAISKLISNGIDDSDFLQAANHLKEIKNAGTAAVAETLANLGLGDAAKRTIGSGSVNIPDIEIADARYKLASYIPPLSRVWLSGEYTPVLNTATIVSHGLTIADPLKCRADVLLKCVVANNGYAVGETAIGFAVWVQSTTILPPTPLLTGSKIQLNSGSQGTGGLLITNRSSGGNAIVINPSEWRYIFRIFY